MLQHSCFHSLLVAWCDPELDALKVIRIQGMAFLCIADRKAILSDKRVLESSEVGL